MGAKQSAPGQPQQRKATRVKSSFKPPEGKFIKALYTLDLDDRDSEDLGFKKDEFFKVINDDNDDWWQVESVDDGRVGFVPQNHFVLSDSINVHSWFHGKISKNDSKKLLEKSGNAVGTFLIRESESIPGSYAMSLLCVDGERVVKHYRIRKMDSGKWYICPKSSFDSLDRLIDYYSKHNGLQCRLGKPCEKLKPVMTDMSKKTRDRWEIDRSKLQLLEELGSGNFGVVWKGLWTGKTTVAIKMLKQGVAEKERFLEEAAVMKQLRHPKLIRLYAVCTEEEPLYIVTEFMAKGCLHTLLNEDKGKTIKWPEKLEFATQIAQGMKYIESKRCIHRDLATRNVLVDDYMLVKIGDFGLSKALTTENEYNVKEKTKFPVRWTAIEAMTHKTFTIKSDVWSFGILLVELLTNGGTPYPGMSNAQVRKELVENNYRHPKPADCPDEMYDLMISCWKKDPSRRPTFEYLYDTLDDFYVSTQAQYVE